MATKFVHVIRNAVMPVAGAGGLTFDPLLREVVGGVEQAVAPHIVIVVPKAAANPCVAITAMATGNINVDVSVAAAGCTADILAWRVHPVLRGDALNDKYVHVANGALVAATVPSINPLLRQAGTLVAPDICIMMQKVSQASAAVYCNVPTAMAVGAITLANSAAGGDIAQDVLMLRAQSIQRVTAALFGNGQVRTRIFTILDTADAGINSIYVDAADATRLYQVKRAKVSGDGSLSLLTEQIGGATTSAAGAAGNLNLVSGTGDAVNAFTNTKWEKYMDILNATNIANTGLTINPGLVENGVEVMPDIVIPIPKAVQVAGVAYVTTDLTGAVGPITMAQSFVGNVSHDILSLRIHSAFR